MLTKTERRRILILAAIICLLTLAAFVPTLTGVMR